MADKWRNFQELQRKKDAFLRKYGKLYGYGGKIDEMQEGDFSRLKGMVYLDHTGTTHYAQSQLEAYMQDLQTNVYGNPHTRSASSRLTTDTIDQLRFRILQHFNTSVEHHSVIFTSGCTGALRLLADSFPWEDGSVFSYLEDNHTSVLGIREVAAKEGAKIVCVTEEELISFSNEDRNGQNQTIQEGATKEGANVVCVTEEEFVSFSNKDGNDQNRTMCEQNGTIANSSKPNGSVPSSSYFPGNTASGQQSESQNSFKGQNQTMCEQNGTIANSKPNGSVPSSANFPGNTASGKQSESQISFSNEDGNDQNRTMCEQNVTIANSKPNGGVPSCSYIPGNTASGQESESQNSYHSSSWSRSSQPTNLFAYPAMCNFSGRKFPQSWCSEVKRHQLSLCSECEGEWYTCLDAACYVSTNHLDLSTCEADFVTLSFYKIFGFPTGLGALIVRKDAEEVLRKTYFGGGTALAVTSQGRFYIPRPTLHDRFEDGTLPFLDIIALRHGFDTLDNLTGGMQLVSQHTFSLAQYVYLQLTSLQHHNGQSAVVMYTDTDFDDITTQGAIVNFNLLRASGEFVGYAEVDKLAALHDIHLRTGCFCNSGACRRHLGLSNEQLRDNYQAGHICGDDKDLISGQPTGSVRISFGYMSTFEDAQFFLDFVQECFVENSQVSGPEETIGALDNPQSSGQKVQYHKTIGALDGSQSSNQKMQYHNKMTDLKLNVQSTNEGLDMEDSKERTAVNIRDSSAVTSVTFKSFGLNAVPEKEGGCLQEDKKKIEEETSKYQSKMLALKTPSNSHQSPVGNDSKGHANRDVKGQPQRYLSNIFLYPVKSCGAFEVKSWQLSARGLLYDREWMVVNENGVCLSQKREPRLCLIRPAIYLTEGVLQLSAEGMEPLKVPLTDVGMGSVEASVCQSKVCGDRITGLDCGNEAADWLTTYLGRPCRLMRQNPNSDRDCKVGQEGGPSADGRFSLSLANESPYLLISRSSVRELQQQITSNNSQVIPVDDLVHRFRGNLVIDGGRPYEEDEWSELMIGQQKFQSRGRCSRCQMVCLDQSTSQRSKEPLMTLLRVRGKKVPFGIHLVHNMADSELHRIQVGDEVIPVAMTTN